MQKIKIKKSDINNVVKLLGFSKTPLRAISSLLFIGVTVGIIYEEMVGVGTWHSFQAKTSDFNVCFTPPAGCGNLIAQEITKAKETIFVQAYGLTSDPIIYQLKAAKNRNVDVRILLDGGNLSDNQSVYEDLKSSDIDVRFDKMPGIAHNKVLIIDRKKVITGSFNFTKAADTKNAENLLLIDNKELAEIYLNNWYSRYEISKNNES